MKAEIDVRDTMKSIALVVSVKGLKRMRMRVKFGCALIRLGGRIIGSDVDIRQVATGGYVRGGNCIVGDQPSPQRRLGV